MDPELILHLASTGNVDGPYYLHMALPIVSNPAGLCPVLRFIACTSSRQLMQFPSQKKQCGLLHDYVPEFENHCAILLTQNSLNYG